MILFFRSKAGKFYVVGTVQPLQKNDLDKLTWLFNEAECLKEKSLQGHFIGPRKEMVTPWSTNAVEITQTMGITGITRIEEFMEAGTEARYDKMLQRLYTEIDQDIFTIHHQPDPILEIDDIALYNQ